MTNCIDHHCPQPTGDNTRQTISRLMERLSAAGFVEMHQYGKAKYFVNRPLIALFLRVWEERS